MNQISLEVLGQTAQALQQNPEMKIKKWSAHIQWKTGVQNTYSIREFPSVDVDEPITLGGTDTAPNPVEHLIGAAGSCFAITFEVMASQQGIQLKEVDVNIEADLNAAVFLGIEEGDAGILNPVFKLKVNSDANVEDITRIAESALSKSPVLASMNKQIKLIIE